jgi:hypothetical protein
VRHRDDDLVGIDDEDKSMRGDVAIETVVVWDELMSTFLLAIAPDELAANEGLIGRIVRESEGNLKSKMLISLIK